MDKSRVAGLIRAFGSVVVRDSLGVSGLAAIVYGVALINEPAGWIVAGAMMVAAAFLLSKRGG